MAKQKNIKREKIMKAAARLFSEKGYDNVSTREITNAVGMNPAALYYYFPSKEILLKNLYEYYIEIHCQKRPDLDELLKLVEDNPPHYVLMKAEFHYEDAEVRDLMDQIIVIASRGINNDIESERFIREVIFGEIDNTLRPLLRRMIELNKIAPFDIDTFLRVLSHYCFSAAALNKSVFKQNIKEYQSCMAFLFSMIKPVIAT